MTDESASSGAESRATGEDETLAAVEAEATAPDAEADTMVGAAASGTQAEKLTRGARIGHFEVESVLGRGGMGVVYAAHDAKLDRRVAIKLVRGDFAGSVGSDERARLEREARALARLSHPNVVQVFETGEHAGQLYIVMEFVDGITLGEHLKEITPGPQAWRDVLGVMVPAGEGLAAAHEAELVHRDFKPDNVLVDRRGRVRVMDFGVAHAQSAPVGRLDVGDAPASADIGLTQTGALLGTPAYMSPEQFEGAKVDARSDQFAYCVVLYEALFGHRPFAAPTVALLLARVLDGPEPSFEAAPCPAPVVEVLRRGLARAPEARFSSMNELLAALREPLARPKRSTRKRALLPLLASFAIVGGATLFVVQRSADEEAAAVAVAEPAIEAAAESGSAARTGRPEQGSTSPAAATPAPVAEPVDGRRSAERRGRSQEQAAPNEYSGHLSKAQIQGVVRENMDAVKACYDDTLREHPTASGRVEIRFVVGEAGNVESADIADSDLGDPFLGSCIASKMMSWRFPPPEGGRVAVNYPFILDPG